MKKYEYKFVRVKFTGIFFPKLPDNYKEIIEQHGIQGWRLVPVLQPMPGVNGSRYVDLVFEREIS